MTTHGSDDQSRVHLRSMVASDKLLVRLNAHHGSPKPVAVSISDECFASLSAPVKARFMAVKYQIRGRLLLRIIAEFYDLTVDEIRSPRKTAYLVRARFAFYYIANKYTTLRWSAVGRLICRDHSTVLKMTAVMECRLAKDERLADEIELIRMKISEQFGVSGEAAE